MNTTGSRRLSSDGLGTFTTMPIEEFTTEHWVSVQREPRSFPIPASSRNRAAPSVPPD